MSLPQAVTQHGDAVATLAIFLRQERAAQQGFCAERLEEARGGVAACHLGRGVTQHEIEFLAPLPAWADRHFREHGILRAPIEVVGAAHTLLVDTALWTPLPKRHQQLGFGIRQWLEKDAVDDAEH